MNRILAVTMLAGFVAAASAQITLERIATVDFRGELSGDSVNAVAWDGSTVYTAAYTNSVQDVGITAADNALTAPAFRTFGLQSSNAFLGYSGLDINAQGQVAAVINTNGTGSNTNFSIYNGATGAVIQGSAPAGVSTGSAGGPRNGVAWDPINGGAAFPDFGAGRFRQVDAAGNAVWDNASGPFNFDGFWGTAWGGIDFDQDGNLYGREGQQLIKFTRTGADSFETPFGFGNILTPLFAPGDGDNNVGQKLAVLEDFGAVLWNDRTSTATGQQLADVVKAVGTDGTVLTINFANSPSDFPSNGIFDFSYDEATQTLAIAEFSSNQVYIYNVTPEPSALVLLGLGALALIRRR